MRISFMKDIFRQIQSLWNPFRDWNWIRINPICNQDWIQSLWNPFRDWNNGDRFPIRNRSRIQSLWNPFRDWNEAAIATLGKAAQMIQSLWNPFRDWNSFISRWYPSSKRFKASETLLGIETDLMLLTPTLQMGFKASETLLGIETSQVEMKLAERFRFKASETLLGIETCFEPPCHP